VVYTKVGRSIFEREREREKERDVPTRAMKMGPLDPSTSESALHDMAIDRSRV